MRFNRGQALLLLCPLFCVLLTGCRPSASTQADSKATKSVVVRTVSVTQDEVVRTTSQPATLHAYFRSELHARAAGFVKQINADIGDVVQKGDVLAILDVPEMIKRAEINRAQIARLEAEEKRASAGVNLAVAKVQSAMAKLNEAQSHLQRVDASLAAAESEFVRTNDLVQRGSLQDRMLDEARKKRDSQQAEKLAVASSIESARAMVEVAKAEKAAADADREAAAMETEISKRQLEELQVLIDFSNIRAPISGVVTRRNIEPGDLVGDSATTVGDKPLYVVSQIDRLRVRIPVPEIDAARVKPGDEISITFPSFVDEPAIKATVTRQSQSLDPSTRTMIVEAELDNAQGKFLPGMFGQATISLSAKIAANMLPARAIRFDAEGNAYVYLVDDNETVTIASVRTGFDDGNVLEVRSGIAPGQRVIDAHLKRFTDGQKVSVLNN